MKRQQHMVSLRVMTGPRQSGTDHRTDTVAVVLLQHAEVLVPELVRDLFDRHPGIPASRHE